MWTLVVVLFFTGVPPVGLDINGFADENSCSAALSAVIQKMARPTNPTKYTLVNVQGMCVRSGW